MLWLGYVPQGRRSFTKARVQQLLRLKQLQKLTCLVLVRHDATLKVLCAAGGCTSGTCVCVCVSVSVSVCLCVCVRVRAFTHSNCVLKYMAIGRKHSLHLNLASVGCVALCYSIKLRTSRLIDQFCQFVCLLIVLLLAGLIVGWLSGLPVGWFAGWLVG